MSYLGIAFADIHSPYEDKRFIGLLNKIIDDTQPRELISVGDFLNYAAYSRHGKRKNEIPYEQIGEDHTHAILTLDSLTNNRPYLKSKIWIDGNHELNQDDYFTEFPDFYDDSVHRYNKLKLKSRGFKIHGFKKPYRAGKLFFTHGWRSGVNAVRTHLVQDYKRNFVMGHIHKSDIATSANIEGKIIQGYSLGCGCKLNFRYARGQSSNLGFGLYYIYDNGNFQFFNIVVTDYKCYFNGQEWSN